MIFEEPLNEFANDIVKETGGSFVQSEIKILGGVKVVSSKNKTVTIKYNGNLVQNGADSVYLHSGYGSLDWNYIKDIPMSQEESGEWKATIGIDPSCGSRLNFCFKDGANNWDNNYGCNWKVDIVC